MSSYKSKVSKTVMAEVDEDESRQSSSGISPVFSVSIAGGAPLSDHTAAPKREFVFSGCVKSLSEMNEYKAPSPFSMFTTQHRSRDAPPGSKRHGDPSQAIVLGVKVAHAWNNLPFGLWVTSPSLSRGRCYGPGDKRAFLYLPPAMQSTLLDRDVMLPTASLYSDAAAMYAGLEPNPELSPELRKMLPENICLIRKGTAHHRLLVNNQEKNGLDVSKMTWDMNSDYVVVGKALYDSIERHFQTKVAKSCPTIDMLSSEIKFEPDIHAEHYRALDDMPALPYAFGCVLEISYRFKK